MVNAYSMFDCLSTMNGRGSSDGAFRLLYNWVDCWCTHAWDKKTREMDTPPLWDIFHYPPLKEIDWKSYEIVKCLASISVMKNVGEWASESGGWVGEMVTYQ